MVSEYQYWINFITIICSVLVFSLAWNSTYWIKDKINRTLAFILFARFYTDIIWRYKKVDDVWAHQSNDDVMMFIFQAINIPMFNSFLRSTAYILFGILVIRISYQFYNKHKGKFK